MAAITARLSRRIYYGWVVAGTLALTETISWGVLYYAFSVFLVPMRRDLGWSEASLTGAYSLSLLVSGLTAPVVGRWIDRNGPRAVMTSGSILGVLLMLAWSRIGGLLGYYLLWAGIGVAMAATLYDPAFTAVTAWFERDRAKAFLMVTVAAGFASTVFLPLSSWLVGGLGWRHALVALAAILGLLTIPPHALLLRRRPEDLGLRVDGDLHDEPVHGTSRHLAIGGAELRAALHDPAFWWLALAFSLETLSSVAVGVYLIAYLTDRGDGARFAAAATGLIGAAQVAARVLATLFGNRLSQIALSALVFALQAVALVVLLNWQTHPGVLTAVLLLGMGRGVVTLMRAGLVAEFYGRRHFGAINGSLSMLLTGARAVAPVGAGAAYAATGDYRPVFWGLATVSLLGAGAMIGVSRCRAGVDAALPAV